jgi:glycosyltransferase involved in cell wall biosynthesis
VKVVTLTTSYPRGEGDHAGSFVARAVEKLREAGVDVTVVAPGTFDDFGLTGGPGVLANARRRPWAAPALLGSMAVAARRAARDADLVHAHWLQAGAAAALTGKPFVVTLHGSDLELGRRAPALSRWILRRATGVIAVSQPLASEAAALGARRVQVIPNGIDLPPEGPGETVPPEVLFVGRLSPEKGIDDLLDAGEGLNVVVAGDGPLRQRVPGALGFVSVHELEGLYRRAAVVACPSHREGFGVACAEAMAYGKPVVASAVGGLLDLVIHDRTGLLVPPRDPRALRAALDRLLGDADLRRRLGTAAREHVARLCSWERVTSSTLSAYRTGLGCG